MSSDQRIDYPAQSTCNQHLHRAGIDRPTPVVGSAQPPRGVSGMMRRSAYEIPEHYARHWMLLMAADRVDVMEDRLGGMLAEPMERIGFDAGARYARSNPLAVAAGTASRWTSRIGPAMRPATAPPDSASGKVPAVAR